MSKWKVLILILFVLPVFVLAGQEAQPKKKVVYKGATQTSPASGEEMYRSYCASCHGTDGKGGGPAAEALKVHPVDLTALTSKNGGVFPRDRVRETIRGDVGFSAHGRKDMPVWGSIFLTMSRSGIGEVEQRLNNLTSFVEYLQGGKKAAGISLSEYRQMLEYLNDLSVATERNKEESVSLEEVRRHLRARGVL
jgi:mono/diheme cytochrome c family protein